MSIPTDLADLSGGGGHPQRIPPDLRASKLSGQLRVDHWSGGMIVGSVRLAGGQTSRRLDDAKKEYFQGEKVMDPSSRASRPETGRTGKTSGGSNEKEEKIGCLVHGTDAMSRLRM